MSADTFVLVGCGDAKVDTTAPDQPATVAAKDLYTSTYFGLKRDNAEVYGDGWAILSALYGVLSPVAQVPTYDRSLDDPDVDAQFWAERVAVQLGRGEETLSPAIVDDVRDRARDQDLPVRTGTLERDLGTFDRLEVLAGTDYIDPLEHIGLFDTLEAEGVDVVRPFQAADLGGLFDQMGWLSDRLDAATDDPS